MRKVGYYRVFMRKYWEIAYYDEYKRWWRVDDILGYSDKDFEQIDETLINPEP